MRFTWDENKNSRNKAKHGVSFEIAIRVFDDPFQLNLQDRHEAGEERWQTIGSIEGVIVLLVAHTFCDENGEERIRIISARKATRQERGKYEQRH